MRSLRSYLRRLLREFIQQGVPGEDILLIGHSHTFCVEQAITMAGNDPGVTVIRVGQGVFERYQAFDADGRPMLVGPCRKIVTHYQQNKLFCCFGGNTHTIFSLINPSVRFNFIFDDDEALDDCARGELTMFSRKFVAESLKKQGGYPETIYSLAATARLFKGQIYQLAPPPPIDDSDYLVAHAGPFSDLMKDRGLAPFSLRLKIYRLYCDLLREECESLGIVFLMPPDNSLLANGSLRPDLYGGDTNHGGINYGNLLLNQVLDIAKS